MKKVDLNLSTKMLKKQKEALESVPQIPEEQVPSNEETTKELVDAVPAMSTNLR
jgi:hypothetical protein